LAKIQDEAREQISEENSIANAKKEKMKIMIAEVKAEKDEADRQEKEHLFGKLGEVPPIHFPYTHGDSLEVAREKLRQEQQAELKTRTLEIESQERQRMGDEMYDSLYGAKIASNKEERDARLYP